LAAQIRKPLNVALRTRGRMPKREKALKGFVRGDNIRRDRGKKRATIAAQEGEEQSAP